MILSNILRTLCIIFLLSCSPEVKGSTPRELDGEPITHDMINEGLETWVKHAERKISHLAAKPQNLFMLKTIQMKNRHGNTIPILAVNVLKESHGYLHFFRWDDSLSDTANYRVVNKLIYKVGKVVSANHLYLATAHYTLGKLEEETFVRHPLQGYLKVTLSGNPLYYCNLKDLVVSTEHRGIGIGTALIRELSDFMFLTRSVSFMMATVPPTNPASLKAFLRNKFHPKTLSFEKDLPNFAQYVIESESDYMISLNRGKTQFVAKCKDYFNMYLSRNEWLYQPKLTRPHTRGKSRQSTPRKGNRESL